MSEFLTDAQLAEREAAYAAIEASPVYLGFDKWADRAYDQEPTLLARLLEADALLERWLVLDGRCDGSCHGCENCATQAYFARVRSAG